MEAKVRRKPLASKSRAKLSVAELFLAYMRSLRSERTRSQRTMRAYQGDIEHFVTYLRDREVTFVEGLTSHILRDYASSMSGAQTTRGRRTQTVLRFLDWGQANSFIDASVIRDAQVEVPRMEPRNPHWSPSQEDIARVDGDDLAAVRDRAAMALLRTTGTRTSDIWDMRLSDLDLDSGRALIRGTHRELDAQSKRLLDAYLAKRDLMEIGADALWVSASMNRMGRPMTQRGMHIAFQGRRSKPTG